MCVVTQFVKLLQCLGSWTQCRYLGAELDQDLERKLHTIRNANWIMMYSITYQLVLIHSGFYCVQRKPAKMKNEDKSNFRDIENIVEASAQLLWLPQFIPPFKSDKMRKPESGKKISADPKSILHAVNDQWKIKWNTNTQHRLLNFKWMFRIGF